MFYHDNAACYGAYVYFLDTLLARNRNVDAIDYLALLGLEFRRSNRTAGDSGQRGPCCRLLRDDGCWLLRRGGECQSREQ